MTILKFCGESNRGVPGSASAYDLNLAREFRFANNGQSKAEMPRPLHAYGSGFHRAASIVRRSPSRNGV
jgi:hypothetical protein